VLITPKENLHTLRVVGTPPWTVSSKAPFVYTAADRFQTLGLRLPGPEFVQLSVNIIQR
jgi:hypothetical protein